MDSLEPQADAKRAPLATSSSWWRSAFWLFVALPFLGFGLFFAGLIWRDLWFYEQIQQWEPAPATIVRANLESERSGGGRRGGGRSTYEATASYQYVFHGKTYQNNRVGISRGYDNLGSYQQERTDELARLVGQVDAATAYVNPRDPAQAILFRHLRPEKLAFYLLFATAFSTLGVWSTWTGASTARRHYREHQLCRRFNAEPWRWREDWNQGRLRHKNNKAWIALIVAVIWNGACWPAYVVALRSGELTAGKHLLMLPFLLGGAVVGGIAGYFWLQRWKWGVTELELTTLPGIVGERFAGVLYVPRRIESRGGVAVRLACIQLVSEEDKSSNKVVWERMYRPRPDVLIATGARTEVPVEFNLPPRLPDGGEWGVKWTLTALAETEGVDYRVEFDVPVFKVAGAPSFGDATAEPRRSRMSLAEIASQANAKLERGPAGLRTLYFPVGRNFRVPLGMLAILAVWFYYSWLAFKQSPLTGLALAGFAVAMLVMMGLGSHNSVRLEFSEAGVTVTRRRFGLFGKPRSFTPQEISGVRAIAAGWASGNVNFWNVELRDRQERRYKLAVSLEERELAEDLAEHIVAAVGLSQSRSGSEASRMELESELPADSRGG